MCSAAVVSEPSFYVERPHLCGRCRTSPGTVQCGGQLVCEACDRELRAAEDAEADVVLASAGRLERFGLDRAVVLVIFVVLPLVSLLLARNFG